VGAGQRKRLVSREGCEPQRQFSYAKKTYYMGDTVNQGLLESKIEMERARTMKESSMERKRMHNDGLLADWRFAIFKASF